MNDDTARLAGLDPETRANVLGLLASLRDQDVADAQRITEALIADLGNVDGKEPPEAGGDVWVAASIAAVPIVAHWMRARGVHETIVSATLSDVGRHLRLHQRNTGRVGFDVPYWMGAVLCGNFYQLGRLQFELRRRRVDEALPGIETGECVLDVHIPAGTPLDPAAVDSSFRQAAQFFARFFPQHPVKLAVCGSWLLDPYLGENLPPTSNLVAFQRKFTRYGEPRDDGLDAMYFVFGRRSRDNLDALPRQTALQRLLLDRIESGDSWQFVRGYHRLSPPARSSSAP
ncbi:MAG: acyltransferase domain-containing protein [Nakamurella sp.]